MVERLITRAKRALARGSDGQVKDVHARREVSRFLKDRAVVKSLFEEIAPKLMGRQGGYTRVIKLGRRLGDAAEVAVLELVDFSTAGAPSKSPKETKAEKGKSKEKSKPPAEGEKPPKTKVAKSKSKPTK